MRRSSLVLLVGIAAVATLPIRCGGSRPGGSAAAAQRASIEALGPWIEAELKQAGIAGFAIALVDRGGTRWTRCWGHEVAADGASDGEGAAAGPQSQWRVGSVSKMFTDLAVMELVEQGKLALDEPVTKWLPDFQPKNPFNTPITLRQLMSHRAGLVREPPLGNYFDASSPTLAATVASLNGTTLVFAPGTKMKYSNAGIAVVGRVVEVVTGTPFTEVVKQRVLLPMDLTQSAFEATPEVRAHRMAAQMWTYWGTTFPAPTFELGMAPAGSLYAPIGDLATAMGRLLDGDTRVVTKRSLDEMWSPQFVTPDPAHPGKPKSGYGFGFSVEEWEGRRRVGHDGAIYGFSTVLALLPEEHLGVAAVAALDEAHGRVGKIANEALRALLADAERREWKPPALSAPLDPALARDAAGLYSTADGKSKVELREQQGELWLQSGATRARIRSTEPGRFMLDDRTESGRVVELAQPGRTLKLGDKGYSRVCAWDDEPRPPPPPPEMVGLIGEYGFDHNVLFVFEKEGRLHALIEWFFDYPLSRAAAGVNPATATGGGGDPGCADGGDVYDFPTSGLYLNESIVFHRKDASDPMSEATEAIAAGVRFPRRVVGTPEGVTFRIQPLKPVEELRKEALAAAPAPEICDPKRFRAPDLVELVKVDPSLRLDIRYASDNNFMGVPFYEQARAFMQRPAAEALARAGKRLKSAGFGLLIHDGYRPWFVTRMFWDGTPPEHHEMVADPSTGSRHNRGCAVDLTLCDPASGRPLRMPSGYDEFSDRANPWYMGGTSEQRWLRDKLRHAFESEGFTVYEHEWWHFDFGAWREYPVLNKRFVELAAK
jgi:CubicO group peptidase (beta-lactamase class C family)/D-alanyl-D-alanine dipeptidase